MKHLKSALFILLSLIALSALTLPEKRCPDLVVVEIQRPDYDSDIDGSVIIVTIANKGNISSSPTQAKLFDIDMSFEEGQALGYDTLTVQLLAENNARGSYYAKSSGEYNPNVDSLDYDRYVEDVLEVPALKPGQAMDLTFIIEDYWIYDSNCEIEVVVDFEEEIKECDEENNSKRFFEWG